MSIVNRIRIESEKNNMTIASIERDLCISNGTIRRWDTSKPSAENLYHVAQLLHCSMEYLLTGKVQSSDLCDSEKELLTLFRSLPDDGKERVKGYIDGYIDALGTDK